MLLDNNLKNDVIEIIDKTLSTNVAVNTPSIVSDVLNIIDDPEWYLKLKPR